MRSEGTAKSWVHFKNGNVMYIGTALTYFFVFELQRRQFPQLYFFLQAFLFPFYNYCYYNY